MQHNMRYLDGSVQNEPHLAWNKKMLALLREMLRWRKAAGPEGPSRTGRARRDGGRLRAPLRRDSGAGGREYEGSPPTKYYRDGYSLSVRLRDFKDSELRFLRHFEVPPDNSLCEQLARVFKRKQRQAIAFRGLESLGCVCESIAAVNNMRVASKDVFAETSAIFGRPMPVVTEPPGELVAG